MLMGYHHNSIKALHFGIMDTLGSLIFILNLGGVISAICDRSGVQLEHPYSWSISYL